MTGTEIQAWHRGSRTRRVGPTTLPVTVQTASGLSNSVECNLRRRPLGHRRAGDRRADRRARSSVPIRAARRSRSTAPGSRVRRYSWRSRTSPRRSRSARSTTSRATGDTKLTTHTVAQNPAVVDTQVCTVTDCSPPSSPDNDLSDVLFLYPPGDPKIDSITPASGPANGGTPVTITGENLGCVTNVSFGTVAAVDATNADGAPRLRLDGHGHGHRAGGKRRHGSDHALDGRERRDRRAGRAKRRSRTPRRRCRP